MVGQFFRVQLLDHALARLRKEEYGWDLLTYPPSEYQHLKLHKNQLYTHKVLQVNFVAHDTQQKHDTVKPFLRFSTSSRSKIVARAPPKSAIMLAASPEDKAAGGHAFVYARVLAILHIDAWDSASLPSISSRRRRLDILWVRWLGVKAVPSRRNAPALNTVGYMEGSQLGTFGFVDPADVIRGAHLIPRFKEGRSADLLSHSFCQDDEKEGDWASYWAAQ